MQFPAASFPLFIQDKESRRFACTAEEAMCKIYIRFSYIDGVVGTELTFNQGFFGSGGDRANRAL